MLSSASRPSFCQLHADWCTDKVVNSLVSVRGVRPDHRHTPLPMEMPGGCLGKVRCAHAARIWAASPLLHMPGCPAMPTVCPADQGSGSPPERPAQPLIAALSILYHSACFRSQLGASDAVAAPDRLCLTAPGLCTWQMPHWHKRAGPCCACSGIVWAPDERASCERASGFGCLASMSWKLAVQDHSPLVSLCEAQRGCCRPCFCLGSLSLPWPPCLQVHNS